MFYQRQELFQCCQLPNNWRCMLSTAERRRRVFPLAHLYHHFSTPRSHVCRGPTKSSICKI